MATAYQRRARILILRSAILKADVVVKPASSGTKSGGQIEAFAAAAAN